MGIEKFTASGLIIEDYGYLNVYKYEKWSDKVLPAYQENEVLTDCQVGMAEGQTRPPPLLNEADLIALMDKHGIGTDATHADHIETIKTRHYATLNGEGRFIPGYIGLALVDGYDQMGFAMSKPHMRANLESQLKKICRGERYILFLFLFISAAIFIFLNLRLFLIFVVLVYTFFTTGSP
ncbi:unnamed protein product [Gongylonema pulchrum]|uniref:DNA topoisomerase n=1 Tax=Gongylonema pulchrum TaxID=637853 RepID=A0A183DIM1_9BILA|nr:unnamed protein product [Gongylonema pulchrum]